MPQIDTSRATEAHSACAPVARMEDRLAHLTHLVEAQHHEREAEKRANYLPPAERRSSVGAAMALLGFKLGGIIGTKIGLFSEAFRVAKSGVLKNTLKDPNAFLKNANDPNDYSKLLFAVTLRTGVAALIGGAIGAVVFGTLGFIRGDRIDDISHLMKRPLQSIKLLLGGKKPEAHPAAPSHGQTIEAEQEELQPQASTQREWTKSMAPDLAEPTRHR